MNKENAIRTISDHNIKAGHDVNGVWAVETVCERDGRFTERIINLTSWKEIQDWLGY